MPRLHRATAPRRERGSRPDSGRQAPSGLDEALRRIRLRDTEGASRILVAWAAALPVTGRARSYLLFDALGQVDRHAGTIVPGAGLSEDKRLLLAQRLGVCESAQESVDVFREAVREILATLHAPPSRKPVVQRACAYVESNYKHRVSLGEVARAAGVSPNYLSHLFRRECGSTLVQFVNRLRVMEAVRLLHSGTRTISEIAYEVGYQNYRDFHRNFVRIEKKPPRLCRGAPRSGRSGAPPRA